MRKMPRKTCYRVYKASNNKTRTTGKTRMTQKNRVFSKCTSLKNAESQLRLLRAIEYGKNFVPRNRTARKNK
jgi:hypothetical protein